MKSLCLNGVIVIAALLVVPAGASELTLKGLKPGMTMIEMFGAHKALSCEKPGDRMPTVDDVCSVFPPKTRTDVGDLRTLGGADVLSFMVGLRADKVTWVRAALDADDADRMEAALVARYGAPAKRDTARVTTRIGANHEQVRLEWRSGTVRLVMISPYGKVTEMLLELRDDGSAEKDLEAIKSRAGRDAKDL